MASPFPDTYLERHDPARNMARFYALSIERDLLGDVVAIRRWGRIGTLGQTMRIAHGTEALACAEQVALLAVKCRRGYRRISS